MLVVKQVSYQRQLNIDNDSSFFARDCNKICQSSLVYCQLRHAMFPNAKVPNSQQTSLINQVSIFLSYAVPKETYSLSLKQRALNKLD